MKAAADFIIPECYVDTNLVQTLACHGGCNHQKGCNQVTKVMREKFSERFAVGMIDADKKQTTYIREFAPLATKGHLSILSHPSRPHYIILVSPAIDKFILDCAADLKVDVADYGFSSILKQFTSQTKSTFSSKDERFRRLFGALTAHPEVSLLRQLLKYLVANQYRSSNADLMELFIQLSVLAES